MERVVERNEVMLCAGGIKGAADFAGELYGGFVGFGAGVADEDAGGVVHGTRGAGLFDEELGEGAGPGVVIEVGCVYELAGLDGVGLLSSSLGGYFSYLLRHQRDHLWITVP